MSVKKMMARWGTLAVGLLALCANRPADAAVLYQNPPQLINETGNCNFTTACINAGIFGASEFTLAAADTVGSVSFTAVEVNGTPNDPTGIDWKIYTDGGNVPGSLIAAGNNFPYGLGPAITGQSFTHYEYTVDIADLALAAGTYWLAFRVISPSFDTFWSGAVSTVPNAQSNDLGATWFAGYAGLNGLAIAVYDADDVIAMAEPGTLALFGLGLAGLGVLLRRRPA